MTNITWDKKREWVSDDNGNLCSVEYFGSENAAEKALKSLINCRNCRNCSGCSHCFDCSGCSGCSHCFDCSDCSDCSRCFDCSGCSGCSHCFDCSDCSDCYRCSRCSRCSDCSRCSGEKDKIGEAIPVPVIHDIDVKVFEAASAENALDMGSWHSCGTTHCRAGWVVHLAGEAGYALERRFNTPLAAMMIYRESGSPISPVRFYDSNEAALKDMRERAEALK